MVAHASGAPPGKPHQEPKFRPTQIKPKGVRGWAGPAEGPRWTARPARDQPRASAPAGAEQSSVLLCLVASGETHTLRLPFPAGIKPEPSPRAASDLKISDLLRCFTRWLANTGGLLAAFLGDILA